MKISGIIRYRDQVQQELERLAFPPGSDLPSGNFDEPEVGAISRFLRGKRAGGRRASTPESLDAPAISEPDLEHLRAQLSTYCAKVEALCTEAGAAPADLPAPSRRAFQWMHGLTRDDALSEHIALRRRAHAIFSSIGFRSSLPRRHRGLSLQLRVEHGSLAYRASAKNGRFELRLSEGFRGAPDEVLRSIFDAALIPGGNASRARVAAYCRQPDFRDRIAVLERSGRRGTIDATSVTSASSAFEEPGRSNGIIGRHHDLRACFDRINERYFEHRLEAPHLRWSARATRRKMGHYEWEGDVVQLNRRLDDRSVPMFVIDFVMYHELLHKDMGFQIVGGRRRVHTPEFRRREREFERYLEAQDFLDNLEARMRART